MVNDRIRNFSPPRIHGHICFFTLERTDKIQLLQLRVVRFTQKWVNIRMYESIYKNFIYFT